MTWPVIQPGCSESLRLRNVLRDRLDAFAAADIEEMSGKARTVEPGGLGKAVLIEIEGMHARPPLGKTERNGPPEAVRCFTTRCPHAFDRCHSERPVLAERAPGHLADSPRRLRRCDRRGHREP